MGSADDAERVVRDFCAAFAKHDAEALRPFFADDVVYHNIPMDPAVGIDATIAFIDGFFAMCQSMVIETALLRWTQIGHHDGCPRGWSCARTERDGRLRAVQIAHLLSRGFPEGGAPAQCNSAVLAGSAAYRLAELFNWKEGLDNLWVPKTRLGIVSRGFARRDRSVRDARSFRMRWSFDERGPR
jgi:ketosteroid isomerase-like protein